MPRSAPEQPGQASNTRPAQLPASPHRDLIHYAITPVDLPGHLYEIVLAVASPAPAGQRLSLPAWIPGSYMIREFARHIIEIEATSSSRRVPLVKLDKHTWQAAPCAGVLQVRYRVYAWDLSVRGAHLDQTHGFFNGTSVFLRVLGQESSACAVEIHAPTDAACKDWQVATTLARDGAAAFGFGRYRAEDYDALIDHPVEMGSFARVAFVAGGVRHHLIVTGRQDADLKRVAADLAPICETQIRFFEPRTAQAPFDRYMFLTTLVGEGYGGLEHRSSTALIATRNDLPSRSQATQSDAYRTFLGLASHEYFHSWMVKRIKPLVYAHYDLDREQYSSLLWVFEGFTSYYDDLMLLRAGVVDRAAYLKLLAGTISNVLRNPGRFRQSVADSSFDAWIRYYRQDENSPNAIVSYYAKGALVALCLDLEIRLRTAGQRSLDDAIRLLWTRFGREFAQHRTGVAEDLSAPDGMATLLQQATGIDLHKALAQWTGQTDELPLARLLAAFGLELELSAPEPELGKLGCRFAQRGADLSITTVLERSNAHEAGVSAGDVLLALDGIKVDERALRMMLGRKRAGETVRLHVFRRDELMHFDIRLRAPAATQAKITDKAKAPAGAVKLARGWLSGGKRAAIGAPRKKHTVAGNKR